MASLYTRFSDDYDQGKKTFTFDSGIYGHPAVKKALIEAQYGKCCYCEWNVTPGAYGDVEHFRPKGEVAEDDTHPGYYWLAYEWSNLLFACQKCNQRKRTFFPLRDPSKRARSHHDDDFLREEPLLINPAEEDPGVYISFRRDIAFPIEDNVRGRVTIEVVGLNRPALVESRFNVYKRMRALSKLPGGQDLLQDYTRYDAEYSAMARAAVTSGFSV